MTSASYSLFNEGFTARTRNLAVGDSLPNPGETGRFEVDLSSGVEHLHGMVPPPSGLRTVTKCAARNTQVTPSAVWYEPIAGFTGARTQQAFLTVLGATADAPETGSDAWSSFLPNLWLIIRLTDRILLARHGD